MKIANDNPKLSFLRKQESRVVGCEKEKATTLDPRLLMSRMTEGETSGTSVGDDRRRRGFRVVPLPLSGGHVHG